MAFTTHVLLSILGLLTGFGGGYAIWGKQQAVCDESLRVPPTMENYSGYGGHAQKSSIEDWEGDTNTDSHSHSHSYKVGWDLLQSYQFKNVLFKKGCQYGRDPPDWEQSKLMSGASRNEAMAMMSRAAIMKADPINTAQLPYKFNFTLVKPVFVGDDEYFTFEVDYEDQAGNSINDKNNDNEESECKDATVTGLGKVDGKVHTISTIKYKCMHDQRRRLVKNGFALRSDL